MLHWIWGQGNGGDKSTRQLEHTPNFSGEGWGWHIHTHTQNSGDEALARLEHTPNFSGDDSLGTTHTHTHTHTHNIKKFEFIINNYSCL